MTNGNGERVDEKILERLAKIKAHAESAEKIGSLEEAEAFASMLERLLTKHKLDMTDLQFEQMEKDEPVEEHHIPYEKYPDLEVKKVRIEWMERLAGMIARAHYCRIIVHQHSSRLSLVGRKTDAEVAEYMIVTLLRAAKSLAKKEHSKYCWEVYKRDKNCADARGFKRAFLNSFIERLEARYEAARKDPESNTSTALVRINKSMDAVNDFIRRPGAFHTVNGLRRIERSHAEGQRRGREAADGINLRANAVKGGGKPSGFLG